MRTSITIRYCMAVFVLCTLVNFSAFSQGLTNSALNGVVLDKAGQPLPGATVIATHNPSGSTYGTSSRVDGRFNIQGLRVGGPYTISAKLVGYKSQTREGLTLALGQNLRIDFSLSEEAVTVDEVSVTAERNSIMSASRTGTATNVSETQITRLPTLQRSLNDIARTSPQLVGTGGTQGGISAAGRNARYNNIQIDGAVSNDVFGLADAGTPGGQTGTNAISLDAIQELQIVVSPFDVRYGGFTGAGINAITRSGTNRYTGSLFGFSRTQGLVGKSPDTLRTSLNQFEEIRTGFRFGGPIIEDNLFFFVNGEITRRSRVTDYAIGVGGSRDFGIPADTLQRFINLLKAKGYDPGSFDDVSVKRPNLLLFGRLDWKVADGHALTLRHSYVNADADRLEANGRTATTFGFSNFNHVFRSVSNQALLQLNSTFSKELYNEFRVGYATIRDKRDPDGPRAPQITVTIPTLNGVTVNKNLVSGWERSSQANSLDQDILEITDELTFYQGEHTLTVGTHNEHFSFENLFIQDVYGTYDFTNLDSLAIGGISRYRASYSRLAGVDQPLGKFGVWQFGLYAQDLWTISPNFTLLPGVRVEVPAFGDIPLANFKADSTYGLRTDQVPGGQFLFSPRVGFNWSPFEERTTQIRGGVGIFSGKTPFVWISNQFSNTGVDFARLDIRNIVDRRFFTVNPDSVRRAGDPRFTGIISPVATTIVNFVDKNFKFPQLLRYSLGIDQTLPWGLTGTLEFTYAQVVNDPFYQDINVITDSTKGALSDGRPLYGTYSLTGTSQGARANATVNRKNSANFTNAILLSNTDRGFQYQLTALLQRRMSSDLSLSAAYVYARAMDRTSVTSSVALSNFQFNVVPGNPNNPPLATSNFELRHRLVGAVDYTIELFPGGNTTLSLIYVAQEGRPYSFAYNGDLNGDGNTANDLIYVPKDKNDIIVIRPNSISAGNINGIADLAALNDFMNFVDGNKALSESKGRIIERNGAREPWTERFDLRISQIIPLFDTHNLEVTFDMLNVGNFLNKDWGRLKQVTNQSDQILRFEGLYFNSLNAQDPNNRKPMFSYGRLDDRLVTDQLESRWQAQLGVRYIF